jgi:micrococcal nuclease
VRGIRRAPGLGAILLLIAGIALLLFEGNEDPGRSGGEPDAAVGAGEVATTVTRVVDGDTVEVKVDGETEDVRYIGVDTPESVAPGEPVECFGKRAAEFNRGLVEGRSVRLVLGAERRDRYGRLLAYVFAGDLLVNAELLRRGYARTLAIPPNTDRADRFDRLEQEAANAGRGLWSAC